MFDYQDAEDPFYPTFEDPFYPAFNNPLWGDANVAWSRIAAAVFLIAILAVAIIGHLSQVGINTAFNDVTPPPAINHMSRPAIAPASPIVPPTNTPAQ